MAGAPAGPGAAGGAAGRTGRRRRDSPDGVEPEPVGSAPEWPDQAPRGVHAPLPERNRLKRPTSNYPLALRDSAVRRVSETTPQHTSQWSAIEAVSAEFGIGSPETLRRWVRQAEFAADHDADALATDTGELDRLRREVAELRRSNAILQATSTFFAAEPDRPHQRS